MAECHKNHLLELQAQVRDAKERQGPLDATEWAKQGVQTKMEEEASAWIAGWNDMVEATAASNGGRPADIRQVSNMLMNVHDRPTIMQAIGLKEDRPVMDARGTFAPDELNIAGFVLALRVSRIADIQ